MLLNYILPLITAILIGLGGRYLGRYGVTKLATSVLCICFLASYAGFTKYLTDERVYYLTYHIWFNTHNLLVGSDFIFDALSHTMFIVVLSISTIVHFYSSDYLKQDPHLSRFFLFLLLFTFFMLILVASNDFILLFVGWEGVGIFSYLLINFWYTRLQANKSALKAVFVNKIGDIALLISIVLIYFLCGSTNFDIVFATFPYLTQWQTTVASYSINLADVITGFLLIGAIGKSAQLGLHVWLPDAMEGPTPVSALLHAATMVTAGVFLLIRCSSLFESTPYILFYISLIGSLTCFFAATLGLFQFDLKRIIAFSTCSQLGYMFLACGLSLYSISLFHLFNHAFFKALLFLTAGSIIHALHDEQDIRKMGGLLHFLPLSFSFFLIASLSLMGIPFLSGFYSKDMIIEYVGSTYFIGNTFFFWLALIAALFTAIYSTRVLYYVFLTKPNFARNLYHNGIHDSPITTQSVLTILAICSILTGYYYSDIFVGFGTTFYNNAIFITPGTHHFISIEFLPFWQKLIPFIGSIGGMISYFFVVHSGVFTTQFFATHPVLTLYKTIIWMFTHKWFFDKIYNTLVTKSLKTFYYSFYLWLDKGIIEKFGPTGTNKGIKHLSHTVSRQQTGFLFSYLTYISIGFFIALMLLV